MAEDDHGALDPWPWHFYLDLESILLLGACPAQSKENTKNWTASRELKKPARFPTSAKAKAMTRKLIYCLSKNR
jgi:hypothetical protein